MNADLFPGITIQPIRSGMMLLKKRRTRRSLRIYKHTEEVDRISELPEPIIHHIMSFVAPKDAARVSALCKRFRSAWNSFPFIFFNETLNLGSYGDYVYGKAKVDKFLSYVSGFLQHRPPNIRLEKFSFRVDLCQGYRRPNHHIDGAIGYAIENHVKELELDFGTGPALYFFPLTVLSAKSIRVLKLKGLKLDSGHEDLMLSHPFVESLSVQFCIGMKTLKVSCQKLKIMEIYSCRRLKKIEVNESNLESFAFRGEVSLKKNLELCDINIAGCKSLKYLSLVYAQITGEWFKSHISNFLLLEDLKLECCKPLKDLYVSSAKLKKLELNNCSELKEIEAVAPNLEYFHYKGANNISLINIGACRSLKDLTLIDAGIEDWWLETTVHEFPFLKNFRLFRCNSLQAFKISLKELETLQFVDCNALREVEIYARSLDTFVYTGGCPKLPMFLIDSACFKAKLSLSTGSEFSFLELRDFLACFGHCRELQITCNSTYILIFPRDLRDSLVPPLYDLKHLKLHIGDPNLNKLEELENLVDSLLWLSPHPYTITFVSGNKEKSLKFEYDVPPTIEEDLFCCYSMPIKCWRHYLKQVTMENFRSVEKEVLQKFIVKQAMRMEATYDNRKPL